MCVSKMNWLTNLLATFTSIFVADSVLMVAAAAADEAAKAAECVVCCYSYAFLGIYSVTLCSNKANIALLVLLSCF